MSTAPLSLDGLKGLQRARQQGRIAFSEGLPNSACPYVAKSYALAWESGWIDEKYKDTDKALDDLEAELARARAKFPSNVAMLAALCEEVGELASAMSGVGTETDVRKEALQVATVALRIAIEGDATDWRGALLADLLPGEATTQHPAKRELLATAFSLERHARACLAILAPEAPANAVAAVPDTTAPNGEAHP